MIDPSRPDRGVERMTTHDKDLLLASLMYYMPMDVRRKVMHEVPTAYNAYCGTESVVTTTVSTPVTRKES